MAVLIGLICLILLGAFWRLALRGAVIIAAAGSALALIAGFFAGAILAWDRFETQPRTQAVEYAAFVQTIAEHARPCWKASDDPFSDALMQVHLRGETDEQGLIRRVSVAESDKPKMEDPQFRAFAARAAYAVLDARCAALSIPEYMRGHRNTIEFVFAL